MWPYVAHERYQLLDNERNACRQNHPHVSLQRQLFFQHDVQRVRWQPFHFLQNKINQEGILSIHIWKEVSYVHANKGNKGFAKTNKTLGTKYFQMIDQKKDVFHIGKIICWLDLIYGYNDNYSFSSQDYIKRRIVSWFIVLQNTANCNKSGKETLMLRALIRNYPIPYSPQSSPSVTESIRSNPNAAYFFQVWSLSRLYQSSVRNVLILTDNRHGSVCN